MNEKDRVLELIKKGIISTEEGLLLLEKLGDKTESGQSTDTPVTDSVAHLIPELNPETPEIPEAPKALDSDFSEEREEEHFDQVNFSGEEEEEKTGSSDFDKEQFKEALNQAKDALKDAGKQAKPFAMGLGQVLVDALDTVKTTINDNVDWKDINVRVPKLSSTPFSTVLEYPGNTASIIDIQSTNGSVELTKASDEVLRLKVDGKIYGGFEGDDALEEFKKRSEINIDDEKIEIKITNKFVKANLVLELPERLYDLVSLKSTNGSLELGAIEAGDIYASTTNGEIEMFPRKASMLEIKGVNGDIHVHDAVLMDTLINSVNADVTFTADSNAIAASLVNGDMRLTLSNDSLTKLDLSNVNGNIKVAFPQVVGLDGKVSVAFGKINHRFQNVEVLNATKKSMEMHRDGSFITKFDIRTTTGSVFLKDTE